MRLLKESAWWNENAILEWEYNRHNRHICEAASDAAALAAAAAAALLLLLLPPLLLLLPLLLPLLPLSWCCFLAAAAVAAAAALPIHLQLLLLQHASSSCFNGNKLCRNKQQVKRQVSARSKPARISLHVGSRKVELQAPRAASSSGCLQTSNDHRGLGKWWQLSQRHRTAEAIAGEAVGQRYSWWNLATRRGGW